PTSRELCTNEPPLRSCPAVFWLARHTGSIPAPIESASPSSPPRSNAWTLPGESRTSSNTPGEPACRRTGRMHSTFHTTTPLTMTLDLQSIIEQAWENRTTIAPDGQNNVLRDAVQATLGQLDT